LIRIIFWEVSTPGIDRKFFKADQMDSFLEEEFNLKLRENKDGKKSIVAKLIDVQNDEILFHYKNEEMSINFKDIDLCRLKPNFEELMRVNK
jgi:ribosome maturation factor RimP